MVSKREKELIQQCWDYQKQIKELQLALERATQQIVIDGCAGDFIYGLLLQSSRQEIGEYEEYKNSKGETS